MSDGWTYIRSMPIWNARKVGQYAFGDDYIDMKKNVPEHTFDLYLREGVDEETVAYYKDFWGGGYKVYIMQEDES